MHERVELNLRGRHVTQGGGLVEKDPDGLRAEGIVAGELCGDVLITDSSYRISEQVAARVGQRIRPTGEFADRKIDVVRVLALVASRERISLHHQECSPRED